MPLTAHHAYPLNEVGQRPRKFTQYVLAWLDAEALIQRAHARHGVGELFYRGYCRMPPRRRASGLDIRLIDIGGQE